LNYSLEGSECEGTGPMEGWISVKLKDKDLATPIIGPDGPPRKYPPFKKIDILQFDFLEMKDRAAKNLPGDYWGMVFPHTMEQIMSKEWGCKWLTKAFIKSGVMTADNEVIEHSMKEVTKDVSGGAGTKFLLTVKYKKDQPYLHTDLFVKLPHEPKGSDRYYVSVMWGHDRPESVFNIWQNAWVPIRTPKVYFCDICRESTNFILITEQVKFGPWDKKEWGPGDIEPAYNKLRDYEMPDGGPMYYFAVLKNLGKMAGYHKTGRLHPQTNEMFPMPDPIWQMPKGIPGQDAMTKKQSAGKWDVMVRFMSEQANKAFPKEITDKKWLEEVKAQSEVMTDFQTEMHCFFSGCGEPSPNDYIVLTHNNGQVDNCIYYHKEDGSLDAGMLDWGVLACGPFINAISGGCVSGAQVDIYIEYKERFIRAACDSYAENGGPFLDIDRLMVAFDLTTGQWVSGLATNVMAVTKDCKVKEWETITDIWNDKRVTGKWNSKVWTSQFHNGLMLYKKMDVWSKVQAWQKSQGLPEKK